MSGTQPALKIERWTAQRKAEVVEAIIDGTLPMDEAFERYRLSQEELGEWWRKFF